MSHSKISVWPIVVASMSIGLMNHAQDAMPRHVGTSNADKFLVCARSLLGKLVFRDTWSLRNPVELPCPTSIEALRKDLDSRGETLYESREWALVYPAHFRKFQSPHGPQIKWYRLVLTITTRNWAGLPDSRELMGIHLDAIGKVVQAEARPAPVATSLLETSGGSASLDYLLRVAAVKLSLARSESVIGVLGEVNGTGRLVFGEFRANRFQLFWDSPLFSTAYLKFGFDDVDGDGVKEILLVSTHGQVFDGQVLSVFTSEGRELTRQDECYFNDYWGFDENGGVCPVSADEIRFDEPRNGKKDLLVRGRYEDVGKADFGKLHRYSLKNGRYVHVGVVPER